MSEPSLSMLSHSAFVPFTDPYTVQQLLRPHVQDLLDAPRELVGCDVLHAWRKTYENPDSWDKSYLNVCYRLRFEREPEALVHGTAFFRHRGVPADFAASGARATLHLDAVDLALRRFPDDDALPQLALLANTARVLEFVPPSVLAQLALLRDVTLEVVNYRPGERCTLRYDLTLDAPARVLTLFAKTYRGETGASVYEHLLQLSARGRAGGVRVAPPLGYDAATRTVWQRGESGQAAAQLLRSAQQHSTVQAIARSLAGLHDAGLTYERVALREQLLFDARKRANKLSAAFPALEVAWQRAVERCAQERYTLPPGKGAPLHGDAHINQFLIDADEAIMFDFDELTYGDAEHDLANFIVSLQLDESVSEDTIGAFLQAYRRHAGYPVDAAVLIWHYRVVLISKAYRAFWRQAPHAEQTIVRAAQLVANVGLLLGAEVPAWL